MRLEKKKQDEYSKMAHSLEVAKNSIMKVTIVDIKTDPVRCRRDPVINARLTGFSTRKSGGNDTDQHPSTVGLLNLKLRIKHLFIFVKKKKKKTASLGSRGPRYVFYLFFLPLKDHRSRLYKSLFLLLCSQRKPFLAKF